jgi:hypothetical protein
MKNKEIYDFLEELEMKEAYRIKFNAYQRHYKKYLYNNDPEYKEKIKKYQKEYYHLNYRKRNSKKDIDYKNNNKTITNDMFNSSNMWY